MSADSVLPLLTIDGAATAIAHYVSALGAQELSRESTPDGEVARAELSWAGQRFLVGDPIGGEVDSPVVSPDPGAPTTVVLCLGVDDVEEMVAQVQQQGWRTVRDPELRDGRHAATVIDPFRHVWMFTSTP